MLQVSASMLHGVTVNQGLTKHSADSIFLIDPEGRIAFANSQAQRVFGFSADELLGKPLHEAINRDHQAGGSLLTSRGASKTICGSDRKVSDQEECFFRKDGSIV